MPLIPILLPPGLERNGTPYDTVKNWWDMNLMRWVSGSARPIGGWVRRTGTPLDSAVRRFHSWQTNDASRRTLAGTDHKLGRAAAAEIHSLKEMNVASDGHPHAGRHDAPECQFLHCVLDLVRLSIRRTAHGIERSIGHEPSLCRHPSRHLGELSRNRPTSAIGLLRPLYRDS